MIQIVQMYRLAGQQRHLEGQSFAQSVLSASVDGLVLRFYCWSVYSKCCKYCEADIMLQRDYPLHSLCKCIHVEFTCNYVRAFR